MSMSATDPALHIPDAVKRAAAKANSYYEAPPASVPPSSPDPNAPPSAPDPNAPPSAPSPPLQIVAAPGPTPPSQPVPPFQTEPPEPAPAPEASPSSQPAPQVSPPLQPPRAAASADVSPEEWQHRYLSMKGRYDQSQQTLGMMNEQMRQLSSEIMELHRLLNARGAQPATGQPPQPRVTPQERQEYGEPLIDLVSRVAQETVEPQLTLLERENRQLKQTVTQGARQGVFNQLGAAVPGWETINTSQPFLQWLRLRDIYSGEIRKSMLDRAFQAADAPRVIAFFKGFIQDEATATGNVAPAPLPQPPRQAPRVAAVSLGTIVAPGRAHPATGDTQLPVEKPVITHAQIAEFYNDVRRGAYAGHEQLKSDREATIFAATREGRIR